MSGRIPLRVACPHCLARPGRSCRSRSGRPCPPHKARVMSACHVLAVDEPPPAIRWRAAVATVPAPLDARRRLAALSDALRSAARSSNPPRY